MKVPELPPPRLGEWQQPERLLAGSDRPRALPPALRAQLEDALLSAPAKGEASEQVPGTLTGLPAGLPTSARTRLENQLLGRSRRRKWQGLAALGTAAAAAAVLIALVAPSGPGRQHVAAHSSPALAAPLAHPSANSFASGGAAILRPEVQRNGPPATVVPNAKAPSTKAPSSRALKGALPAVSSLSPASGPPAGGNWVNLQGRALGDVRSVYFGTAKAKVVQQVSAGELRAVAPPHAPGAVSVSVVSPEGRSPAGTGDRYTFTATAATAKARGSGTPGTGSPSTTR